MKIVTRAVRFAGMLAGLMFLSGAGDALAQETGAGGRGAPAQASGTSSPHALEAGDNEFGVWGGGSFDSPTLWGSAENARFGIVGLRYARVVWAGDAVAVKYTLDAVPVAALNYERTMFAPRSSAPATLALRTDRETVYGAGLAPIGGQLNFRRRQRVQPFAQISFGFLYFADDVPEERSAVEPDRHGAQFNFTADVGGGVQVLMGRRRAVTLGYRYHHLSNGYRAPYNPGYDSNLFYAGFSFFK